MNFTLRGMLPEEQNLSKSQKRSDSPSKRSESPSGSRLFARPYRGSQDLSALRDVLNKMTKSDEHAEHELETKYEQIRQLSAERRERIIKEVLSSESYKPCGARLKFVQLLIEDRMHQLDVALSNIRRYKEMKYPEEKKAAIAEHHKAFYELRMAIIEKLLCQDPKAPLYNHQWQADSQLIQHRLMVEKEIQNISLPQA